MSTNSKNVAQNSAASVAEQFENLDPRTQNDLKHEAWSRVAKEFVRERSELHDRLDNDDAWDEMELRIREDENGRKYFHKVTGVQYAPNHENGKRLTEAAHEFLNGYRNQLSELVRRE